MVKSSRLRNRVWSGRSNPRLTRLEDRLAPAAQNFFPPSQFFVNPATGPIVRNFDPSQSVSVTTSFLAAHAADFGLTAADVASPLVTSRYTDTDTGITHLYLRQQVNGLPVAFADFSVAVTGNGMVFSVGGGFVAGAKDNVNDSATVAANPSEAVRLAAIQLGFNDACYDFAISPVYGNDSTARYFAPAVSLDIIPMKQVYLPRPDGQAVLAWSMILRTPDGDHWYDAYVEEATGSLAALCDWVDDASYNVIAQPNESPQDGGFVVVSGVEDPTASPFGWHDTNGVAGAEFTDTRGNNVDSHLDRNNDNAADPSPPRPSGGASLDFSGFTFDATQAPTTVQNQNVAMINLFYFNNVLHDIHYLYGFTEAAGNFQVNNYGKGGLANDAVQADCQDGGGTDNANFATPIDGQAPRMQMYLFTGATPQRDGDLDNGIIAHEFGHGVSNRLTGGPANSNALNATQSGGMGEGWSDFYALMLTQRPTDVINQAYPMGTYALNQPPTGPGIRRKPYSYDMTIDPLDFDAYGTSGATPYGIARSTEVHNSGELWCSTLWDLNWLLINKYGFDANLYTGWTPAPGPGHAGNKLALKLVMEAMKLQPANPSFIQARDAIIAADNALNGGADLLEIWTAFARRGLGQFASTANSNATTLVVDYTIPSSVLGLIINSSTPANGSVIAVLPTDFTLVTGDPIDPLTLAATDLTVDGIPADSFAYTPGSTSVTFSFTTSPVTSEGLHTIAVAADAFERASDNKAVLAFTASFHYDLVPMQVVSTSPAVGASVSLPLTTLDVNLNEPVAPGSVSNGDLTLSQGSVSGFSLLNSNQTIRFTLTGITAEGLLNVSIAAGALTDVFTNANVAFSGSYSLDIGTVPLSTPTLAQSPSASLIYTTSGAGIITPSADIDGFTLAVDAGQTLTVLVTPTDPALQPTIEARDPGNNLLGSALASAAGKKALLNTVTVATSGTYTFNVGAAGGTSGSFAIQVILNAALESEQNDGASNDTLATAQDINASFIDLQNGLTTGKRAAISGRVGVGPIGGAENFESGTLPATFTTYVSNSFGHIQVTAPGGTGNTSSFALIMDSTGNGSYALNEAIYTINLTGATIANLSFSHINFNDEAETLPASFSGHFNGDGVSFSGDGVNWRTLLNAPTNTTWTTSTFDLAAAAAAAGIPLGPNFKIKFQQYDNFEVATDGRGYDDIQVTSTSEEDWSKITVGANESITVALAAPLGGTINVALLDSGGVTLANGVAGPTNVAKLIQNFVPPTPGDYYLKITGTTNTNYTALVEKNIAYDAESNDTAATAQNLTSSRGVLGTVAGATTTNLFDLTGPTLTGPTVLTGTKITLGINPDGSFITAAGGTGIMFNGTEFVVPGTPLASFTVGYNGLTFTNNGANSVTQITGVIRQDLSTATSKGVRVEATISGVLKLERVVIFGNADEYVTIATRLTNLSAGTLNNVATLENIDPDQDFAASGSYTTANDVVLGNKFVRGTGVATTLTVGLGSSDPRSFVSAEGFDNRNPFDIINSPADPGGVVGDIAIAQAFNFGNLSPSAKVSAIAVMAFGTTAAAADSTFSANSNGVPVANVDWFSYTMPAGQNRLKLSTSTPADGPNQFQNVLDPDIRLYDSTGTTLIASGVLLPDGRNESINASGLTPGASYRIQVAANGTTSGEYFLGLVSEAGPPAAKVSSVVVNAGDPQRSRVTQVTVNFDQIVNFSGAPELSFQLKRQSDNAIPSLTANVNNSGPGTVVTLSFSGTTAVDFGSLADGRYTLTIDASKVSNANGNLDGDGNNTAGGNYVLVGDPTTGPKLYRLFGDADGNGLVDGIDFGFFRTAFNTNNPVFDFDLSTLVDGTDFGEFRNRFGLLI